MDVLGIPEDFRKDQYILKPLVQSMMTALEKPKANVRVCQDPLLGGISQALDWENIEEILDRYKGMVQVFLLLVDRDGETGRRAALDNIQIKAGTRLETAARSGFLLAEHAWQEVEIWALAACDNLPSDWCWEAMRAERDVKETYFIPYVRRTNYRNQPGEGRLPLGKRIPRKYQRVKTKCPEDVAALEAQIGAHLDRTSC